MNQAKEKKEIQFDSLSNWQGFNYEAYLGQTMQLMPTDFTYDFFSDVYDSFYLYNRQPLREQLIKALAGETFKVIDVIKDDKNNIFLKLSHKHNSDSIIINYRYNTEPYASKLFPFIVTAYFEKLKSTHLEKKACLKINPNCRLKDYVTGKRLKLIPGSTWTCKDFVIDASIIPELKMLFTNAKGETIGVAADSFDEWFVTPVKRNILEAKYGKDLVLAALNKEIRKGMSQELVRIAWGNPERINNSSYGEQWDYEENYVYFKNGVVTGWN